MPTLAHQLLGQTRSAVLSALLLHPDASLHVRELARLTGASAGSLHRELRLLADMGLLLRQEIGRQVHYRANSAHPVYAELSQLLRKTAGLVDVLRQALEPLGDKVELAFVYGSMASGTERAGSDVDLMVLGKASFADIARALADAHVTLRREVNPTVMSRREFADRVASGDGFARSVMKGDKLWLKGEDRDLAEPVEDRAAEGARAQRRRGAAAAGRDQAQPGRRGGQGDSIQDSEEQDVGVMTNRTRR
jgi:predicted nucleotidyltransferase